MIEKTIKNECVEIKAFDWLYIFWFSLNVKPEAIVLIHNVSNMEKGV